MTTSRLTDRQRRILAAVNAGHLTMRAIMDAADISSTSVVNYNLQLLAEAGLIVLEPASKGFQVYDGREFCAAWDSSARLSGNPNA